MAGREQDRERRRRRNEGSSARRPDRGRRTGRGGRGSSGPRSGPSPAFTGRRARSKPGTGGAFGLSSTRRAALLALVVCALTLSVAVPLRTYLTQRAAVAEQLERQRELREQEQQLLQRKAELEDPVQIEAEARRRLGYVKPGETPYVVHLPEATEAATAPGARRQDDGPPWYTRLWDSINARTP